MTQKNSSKIISVVHPICCGLSVHKDMVSACIIITASDGEETFVIKDLVQIPCKLKPVSSNEFHALQVRVTLLERIKNRYCWHRVRNRFVLDWNALRSMLLIVLGNLRHKPWGVYCLF